MMDKRTKEAIKMLGIAKIKAKLKKDYKFNYDHYGPIDTMNIFIDSLLETKK